VSAIGCPPKLVRGGESEVGRREPPQKNIMARERMWDKLPLETRAAGKAGRGPGRARLGGIKDSRGLGGGDRRAVDEKGAELRTRGSRVRPAPRSKGVANED